MNRIEHLLSREIGLCAASIGSTAIEIAVKTRMHDTGCSDFERYAANVQHSPKELRALIEHIVVSETWFFRDSDVFSTLATYANGAGRKPRAGRALRVLSVPCATGEEAYSVAITLLEVGLRESRFTDAAAAVAERVEVPRSITQRITAK